MNLLKWIAILLVSSASSLYGQEWEDILKLFEDEPEASSQQKKEDSVPNFQGKMGSLVATSQELFTTQTRLVKDLEQLEFLVIQQCQQAQSQCSLGYDSRYALHRLGNEVGQIKRAINRAHGNRLPFFTRALQDNFSWKTIVQEYTLCLRERGVQNLANPNVFFNFSQACSQPFQELLDTYRSCTRRLSKIATTDLARLEESLTQDRTYNIGYKKAQYQRETEQRRKERLEQRKEEIKQLKSMLGRSGRKFQYSPGLEIDERYLEDLPVEVEYEMENDASEEGGVVHQKITEASYEFLRIRQEVEDAGEKVFKLYLCMMWNCAQEMERMELEPLNAIAQVEKRNHWFQTLCQLYLQAQMQVSDERFKTLEKMFDQPEDKTFLNAVMQALKKNKYLGKSKK
jgi:hypothetical protein